MNDFRGIEISIDDVVVYGKSNRDNPINIGKVVDITEDHVEILGNGNVKTGKIPKFHSQRIVVLPEDYLE